MDRRPEEAARDRAILIVRLATLGGAAGALGMTWLFSNLAATYFSGKAPAAPAPPEVPVAAAPVQTQPPVVQTIVHHPYRPGSNPSGGAAPRPPAKGPAAAPPPPPPPVCQSTPSKPC